jgi:hypothetical protein
MYFNDKTKEIICCAYRVHNKLGAGFFRKNL